MEAKRRVIDRCQWVSVLVAGLLACTLIAAARPAGSGMDTSESRIEIALTRDREGLNGTRKGSFEVAGEPYRVVVETVEGNRFAARFRFANANGSVGETSTGWLPLYGSVSLGSAVFEIFALSASQEKLLLLERSFVMRASRAPNPGDPAPSISATTLNGEAFDLEDHRGKYVLLDFWGTWCAPCLENAPHLEAVRVRYGRDLVIVGIARDSTADVRRYVDTRPVPITQIIQETMDHPIIVAYGVRQFPTYYLIDPNGTIVSLNVNQLRGENLKRNIQFLLG